jgi:hypothetical protein
VETRFVAPELYAACLPSADIVADPTFRLAACPDELTERLADNGIQLGAWAKQVILAITSVIPVGDRPFTGVERKTTTRVFSLIAGALFSYEPGPAWLFST